MTPTNSRSPTFRLTVLCVLALPAGCRGDGAEAKRDAVVRPSDRAPIDASAFATDPQVQRRILNMPFDEVAARLGSLRFEAKDHFVFSRGSDEYEQSEAYRITQDSLGNARVVLETPGHQVEVYIVGEAIYVRQDKGHLRHKSRREEDSAAWCETAYGSVQQVLALFGARLRFVDPRPERVAGRQAVRYQLTLAEPGAEASAPPVEPSEHKPPAITSVTRWREIAKPLGLSGQLWLDSATGVLSRLVLEGRLEVADRKVRPTQLVLRFDAIVRDVGQVAQVTPPESTEEFHREQKPGDLLGFFRPYLEPAPAPKR